MRAGTIRSRETAFQKPKELDERCLYLQDVTTPIDEIEHALHVKKLVPREMSLQSFPRQLWIKFHCTEDAQDAKAILADMTERDIFFSSSLREDDIVVFDLFNSTFEEIDRDHLFMVVKRKFAPTLEHVQRVSNYRYHLIVHDLRDVDHLTNFVQQMEYDGGIGHFTAFIQQQRQVRRQQQQQHPPFKRRK